MQDPNQRVYAICTVRATCHQLFKCKYCLTHFWLNFHDWFVHFSEILVRPSYRPAKFPLQKDPWSSLNQLRITKWFLRLLWSTTTVDSLKYGSEEKGSSLCKCSILLGFSMSKKLERLRSELLSEDKITNLLGFLTK